MADSRTIGEGDSTKLILDNLGGIFDLIDGLGDIPDIVEITQAMEPCSGYHLTPNSSTSPPLEEKEQDDLANLIFNLYKVHVGDLSSTNYQTFIEKNGTDKKNPKLKELHEFLFSTCFTLGHHFNINRYQFLAKFALNSPHAYSVLNKSKKDKSKTVFLVRDLANCLRYINTLNYKDEFIFHNKDIYTRLAIRAQSILQNTLNEHNIESIDKYSEIAIKNEIQRNTKQFSKSWLQKWQFEMVKLGVSQPFIDKLLSDINTAPKQKSDDVDFEILANLRKF